MIDSEAFREFERAAFDKRATRYDSFFTGVSDHNVEPLLHAARVRRGSRVLDVGCGAGDLAGAAATQGASVVGVDLADGMVKLARERHPELEFRRAEGEHLPFADDEFDAVVANLLLPHLPRAEAGLAEMLRVLKPGGWLAMSMWDRPELSRLSGVVWDAIVEVGAPPPAGIPPGPPTFRYSDEGALKALFGSAGLGSLHVERVEFEHPIGSPDELWTAWTEGTVRTAAVVSGQPEDVRRRIRAVFDRLIAVYETDDGLAVPVAFLIASGVKAAS